MEEIKGLTYDQWRDEIAKAARGERDKSIMATWPEKILRIKRKKYRERIDKPVGELLKMNAFGDSYCPYNYTKAKQKKIEKLREEYNKAIGDDYRSTEKLLMEHFEVLKRR